MDEWSRYSEEIMKGSEKKIKNSRLFEVNVKILLEKIIEDLREQYNVVNEAFHRQILDMKEAKLKLEGQHYEVCQISNIIFFF